MLSQNISKKIDENCKTLGITTRPNSSPGLWLCTLLPLAYTVSAYQNFSSQKFEYRLTVVSSFGLCLQSITLFIFIIFGKSRNIKIADGFLPLAFTTILNNRFLRLDPYLSIFFAFIYTYSYRYVFIKLMKSLPRCFSLGEGALVAQGFVLFVITSMLQIPYFVLESFHDEFDALNRIMMTGLLCVTLLTLITMKFQIFQKTVPFYGLLLCTIVVIFFIPVTSSPPIVEVFNFIFSDTKRVLTISFYGGMLALSAAAIMWQLNKSQKATTAMRKVFHILLIFVYLPGLLYQCSFFYLSTGVALSGLVLLELMRLIELYPFHEILKESFNIFSDEKEVGNIALTPFYLLIGCSLPLWISPTKCEVDTNLNLLIYLSGVLTVGVGDTAASVIGYKFGKHRLPYTNKSVEGLVANIVSQTMIVGIIYLLNLVTFNWVNLAVSGIAIIFVSFVEAYTDQVDNIVLPLLFYIIVSIA